MSIADRIAERRHQLQAMRDHARRLLGEGAGGLQITSYLSETTDRFLLSLIESSLSHLDPKQSKSLWDRCAVIAVGGTGRRELAPYSDIDLLFLSDRRNGLFSEVASEIIRDCWDCGLKIGQTVQTVGEARALAKEDSQFATSLVSARGLIGDAELVKGFRSRVLRDVVKRRPRDFIRDCIAGRADEREQFGEAVKQLEPDVKRAPGGLRDVHLMQWLAYAIAEVNDLDGIRMRNLLSRDDDARLRAAYEFLTRIRVDLHLFADRPHDVFTRDDQLRIAAERGVEADPGRRPVERLMQTYFRHSSAINEISGQFVRRHQPRSRRDQVLRPLMSHRFDRIYVMRREGIDVAPRHREAVCSDLDSVLKLFLASLLYGVDPAPEILHRIRHAVPTFPEQLTVESGKMFRQILRSPGDLGRVLRCMYATGVLEHLLPPFAHTRGLIQFNQYHSYTVDEHTLRAVEAAVKLSTDPGKPGSAFRAIRHKASLFLSILLHDVGKGFERDHSELGAEIATEMGPRFTMSPHKAEMVSFLVLKHLRMSHLALRRDISDTQLVVDFAREIGSPERLRMLYVLTVADITAVGPGVFTDWKAELLDELYSRVMEVLSGRPEEHLEEERAAAARTAVREELQALGQGSIDPAWLTQELDEMPLFYLTGESPNRVALDLMRLQSLPGDDVDVWGHYLPETDVVEYRVITRNEPAQGCFHRIAGTLAALRMDVLSAGICTMRDGVVIDAFRVTDNDFIGEVPPTRIQEVAAKLRGVLLGEVSVDSLQSNGSRYVMATGREVSELEPRVVIDNDCSRDFTVIDVFAYDRPGLLYGLSQALHELNLSVQQARIGTHLDQVVDVFYVTDLNGDRVEDETTTALIRERLHSVIAETDCRFQQT